MNKWTISIDSNQEVFTCRSCGIIGAKELFTPKYHYYKTIRRTYYYFCRPCFYKYHKASKQKKPEKYLALRREKEKRRYARWPEKASARRIASYHRAEIKKSYCEICNSHERLEMHHTDYSQPLLVQTLCARYHKEKTYHHV